MASTTNEPAYTRYRNNTNPQWWKDAGLRVNVLHCAGLYFCVFYLGYVPGHLHAASTNDTAHGQLANIKSFCAVMMPRSSMGSRPFRNGRLTSITPTATCWV